jgi:hypothetical protein
MKAFGFFSIIETLLQSHVSGSKLATIQRAYLEGDAVMVKFNQQQARAGAAFVLAVGQSVIAIPSFAQRSAHRCAATVRYLRLAVICHVAPVLIELLMDPCASQMFTRCLAALLRLVAAAKPIAALQSPRMSAPDGLSIHLRSTSQRARSITLTLAQHVLRPLT